MRKKVSSPLFVIIVINFILLKEAYFSSLSDVETRIHFVVKILHSRVSKALNRTVNVDGGSTAK